MLCNDHFSQCNFSVIYAHLLWPIIILHLLSAIRVFLPREAAVKMMTAVVGMAFVGTRCPSEFREAVKTEHMITRIQASGIFTLDIFRPSGSRQRPLKASTYRFAL